MSVTYCFKNNSNDFEAQILDSYKGPVILDPLPGPDEVIHIKIYSTYYDSATILYFFYRDALVSNYSLHDFKRVSWTDQTTGGGM